MPIDGFKSLQGMSGVQRFSIHRCGGQDRLPAAHTCFNQLDLPEYSSMKTLQEKLLVAIRCVASLSAAAERALQGGLARLWVQMRSRILLYIEMIKKSNTSLRARSRASEQINACELGWLFG